MRGIGRATISRKAHGKHPGQYALTHERRRFFYDAPVVEEHLLLVTEREAVARFGDLNTLLKKEAHLMAASTSSGA